MCVTDRHDMISAVKVALKSVQPTNNSQSRSGKMEDMGSRLMCTFGLYNASLTFYNIIPTFKDHKEEGFGKHCEKRRKCW